MRGRIRSVKPELFTDEKLWDLSVDTGLPVTQAFVGLWCFADKEGRFEWRPRALKTAILPYWDGDFARVLDALTTRGFVVKYASGDREYGFIRTFKAHQVLNNREKDSELPAPPESADIPRTSTREPRVNDASESREPRDSERSEWIGNGNGNGKGVGAHTERVREEPLPEVGRDEAFDALPSMQLDARVRTRFRKLYLARYGTDPGANARSAADLPERLQATATAQGMRASELLERTVGQWFDDGRPGLDKAAAYAAFATRFDKYVAPPTAAPETGRESAPDLRTRAAKAVGDGDHALAGKLIARAKELEAADERSRRGR